MTCTSKYGRVTGLGCERTGELGVQSGGSPVERGCKPVAMSFRFTHSGFRIPEDTMSATTDYDHYIGIDGHERQAQVAVLDDGGTAVEEIRVANAYLDEIAGKYAESRPAIEAGNNYFTIYDRSDKELDDSR